MRVEIRDRSFNRIQLPDNVKFAPELWGANAQGGPRYARVRATGDPETLHGILGWLGYELHITSYDGTSLWWGGITRAMFEHGGKVHGVGLDTMYNKVAVVWSNSSENGTTAWAQDDNSVSVFGVKERLLAYSGINEPAAEQMRDGALNRLKEPVKEDTLGRPDQMSTVLLECRGWFDFFEWTHCDRDEGLIEHVPSNSAAQKVGWGFTSSSVGFTAVNKNLSQLFHRFNTLEKGEKVKVTGAAQAGNNIAFTIASTNDRERTIYTASTIAFMQEVKRSSAERLRAAVSTSPAANLSRKLTHFNLHAHTTLLTTLSGTSAQDATTIQLNSIAGLTGSDRVRIELNAGGYHETFISGTPDSTLTRIDIEDPLPSEAVNGADLYRVNRWVTNEAGDVFYSDTGDGGTDYSIDATNGVITFDNTGAIANNQVVYVTYLYTENRIEDTALGLDLVQPTDIVQITGAAQAGNNAYFRVLTAGAEGEKFTVRETVTDEGPGNSITISRGSNASVEETPVDELPGSSVTVTGYGVKVAQSFTVPSDEVWPIAQVEVKVRKVGTPTDNLTVAVHTNSGGHAALSATESVNIPADDLSTQLSWATAQFSNTFAPALGASYWLVVGRSGAPDSFNYYEVAVDEDLGMASSVLEVYDGAAWQSRPINADLQFRILGAEETTEQIATIAAEEGQFIAGVDIVDASGIATHQYRDGRTSVLFELEDLLEIGTTNDRRLLATVTENRILRVHEEPAEPVRADYVIHSRSRITDSNDREIDAGSLEFVGKWCTVGDEFATPGGAWWAREGKFLADSAEYADNEGEWDVQPRGAYNPWEIGLLPNE